MSLTLHSNFETKTILKENWLFQLFYDDESSTDFFGISYYDTTVTSVNYKGSVLNSATIRESINLENSTAKTSNVTITLANFIDGNGTHFSRQLLNGTNHYINRTVKIFIQPDDDTDIADCVQIYSGRLEQISHTVDKITLSVVAKRPWDNIQIPNTRTDTSNRYFPVAYGDYVENSTIASNIAFATSKALYPVPVDKASGQFIYCLLPRSYNGSSGHDARLHYYESNLDIFVPVQLTTSSFQDVSETYQGGNAVRCAFDLSRSFKTKPTIESSDDDSTNPENSFDEPLANDFTGTYATITNTINYTANNSYSAVTDSLKLDPPNVIGKISELKIKVAFNASYTDDDDGGSHRVDLIVGNSTTQLTGSGNQTQVVTVTSAYTNNNNQIPQIEIKDSLSYVAEEDESGTATSTTRIYDVQVWIKVALDTSSTDATETAKAEVNKINTMYIGAHGLTANYDGRHITEIHEAHRDLLHRNTSYSGTPTNWGSGTNIESNRDWKIRFWVTEQTPLIKLLEKLQFEGGFIGRFNSQGDYQYIFIPDSPSASVTLTTSDIVDVNISSTPVNSLTTKMNIEYEKHPAENKYMNNSTSVSANDATLLTNFNIQGEDNEKDIKLDAYVSPTINTSPSGTSNKNDCFFRYYDHILGKPRLIVSFKVVNPKYLGLDVGDIIAINFNDTVLPFAGSTGWDDYKFMITDVSRSVGILQIKVREI